MTASFALEDYFLSIVDFTPEEVRIVASNRNYSAATKFLKKDAPAVALAVLEAAYNDEGGYVLAAIDDLRHQIRYQEKKSESERLDKEANALRLAFAAGVDPEGPRLSSWANVASHVQDGWRQAARNARATYKPEEAKA